MAGTTTRSSFYTDSDEDLITTDEDDYIPSEYDGSSVENEEISEEDKEKDISETDLDESIDVNKAKENEEDIKSSVSEQVKSNVSKLSYCSPIITLLMLCLATTLPIILGRMIFLQPSSQKPIITYNNKLIMDLVKNYPEYISEPKVRLIRNRLRKMSDEMSVLVLLGQTKDFTCRKDPTFCISQIIANSTNSGYHVFNSLHSTSSDIHSFFSDSYNSGKYVVVIDSLQELSGKEATSLFTYIDDDSPEYKYGMIIFSVYGDLTASSNLKALPCEIVENILSEKWSEYLNEDRITPLLSRITGSVIKIPK